MNLTNKQIKEIKNIWQHEHSANNILRDLIMKTQKDYNGNIRYCINYLRSTMYVYCIYETTIYLELRKT